MSPSRFDLNVGLNEEYFIFFYTVNTKLPQLLGVFQICLFSELFYFIKSNINIICV